MEIHDEGILSDFLFGMKKGAYAPFCYPKLAFDQPRYLCCSLFLADNLANQWPEEQ
jgi:hypothetical protein